MWKLRQYTTWSKEWVFPMQLHDSTFHNKWKSHQWKTKGYENKHFWLPEMKCNSWDDLVYNNIPASNFWHPLPLTTISGLLWKIAFNPELKFRCIITCSGHLRTQGTRIKPRKGKQIKKTLGCELQQSKIFISAFIWFKIYSWDG